MAKVELQFNAGLYHSGKTGRNYIELEPLVIGLLRFQGSLLRSNQEPAADAVKMIIELLDEYLVALRGA